MKSFPLPQLHLFIIIAQTNSAAEFDDKNFGHQRRSGSSRKDWETRQKYEAYFILSEKFVSNVRDEVCEVKKGRISYLRIYG